MSQPLPSGNDLAQLILAISRYRGASSIEAAITMAYDVIDPDLRLAEHAMISGCAICPHDGLALDGASDPASPLKPMPLCLLLPHVVKKMIAAWVESGEAMVLLLEISGVGRVALEGGATVDEITVIGSEHNFLRHVALPLVAAGLSTQVLRSEDPMAIVDALSKGVEVTPAAAAALRRCHPDLIPLLWDDFSADEWVDRVVDQVMRSSKEDAARWISDTAVASRGGLNPLHALAGDPRPVVAWWSKINRTSDAALSAAEALHRLNPQATKWLQENWARREERGGPITGKCAGALRAMAEDPVMALAIEACADGLHADDDPVGTDKLLDRTKELLEVLGHAEPTTIAEAISAAKAIAGIRGAVHDPEYVAVDNLIDETAAFNPASAAARRNFLLAKAGIGPPADGVVRLEGVEEINGLLEPYGIQLEKVEDVTALINMLLRRPIGPFAASPNPRVNRQLIHVLPDLSWSWLRKMFGIECGPAMPVPQPYERWAKFLGVEPVNIALAFGDGEVTERGFTQDGLDLFKHHPPHKCVAKRAFGRECRQLLRCLMREPTGKDVGDALLTCRFYAAASESAPKRRRVAKTKV